MLAFGIPVLDQVVEGARVVVIYGEAGAGKTTLALQALLTSALHGSKGLLALDEPATVDRLAELAGGAWEHVAEKIYIYELKELADISRLIEAADEVDGLEVIVVDGVDRVYRRSLGDFEMTVVANRMLNEQLSRLRALAHGRQVCVIETIGVTAGRTPVAGEVILRYADLAMEVTDLGGELRLLKVVKPCCLLEVKLKLEQHGFSAL